MSTTTGAHRVITPRVLYFGNPVVLISTENPDGSFNLAPMSSAWWVGGSCLLGLDETSATTHNLRRTGELVLNLPSSSLVDAVDRLAMSTGTPDVPSHKRAKGYHYLADKFGHAGLTPMDSDLVQPPRVAECPIALEATVTGLRAFDGDDSGVLAIEARILRTHAVPNVLVPGSDRYIDPDRWDPIIMKFTHLYGHGTRLRSSRLAAGWGITAGGSRRDDLPDAGWRAASDGVDRAEVVPMASVTRWRLREGAALPEHGHERLEHVLVRSGRWALPDGRVLGPGEVLATGPDGCHGGVALTDTELWAVEDRAKA